MRDRPGSPWDAVGGDPVSGDPDAFAIWAKRFRNVADATADSVREMRRLVSLVDDGTWVGDSADAFRARAHDLLGRLEAEHDADAATGEALSQFGKVLREMQADALVTLDRTVGPAPDDAAGRALQGTRSVYGLAPVPGAGPDLAELTRVADDLRERIRAAEDRAIETMEAAVPRFVMAAASDPVAVAGPRPGMISASERAAAIDGLCDGTLRSEMDRRHLTALLLDAAAKASRDPAYAAALLSALGVGGVQQLLARLAALDGADRRTLLAPLGALLTAGNDEDPKARGVVDGVVSSDTWRLDLLLEAGLDNQTAWALALVLLKCDPGEGQLHKDPTRYQRQALEFLARRPDLGLRYANEHTDQLMTYLGLSDARSDAAAQILAVGLAGPLPPAHRQQIDAALERVMAAMAKGARPAPAGQLVIAQLLRARIDEVAFQASIGDSAGKWRPGEGQFNPPRRVIRAVMAQFVDDVAARDQIMTGIADYTTRQFRDAAVVAVDHLAPGDQGFEAAFNVPAQNVGHLHGLLSESFLEARAEDAAAGKSVVSVLQAATTLAQGASGTGVITGLATDAVLSQTEHWIGTDVPKTDPTAFANRMEDLIASSLERAMTPEQRADFLSPPLKPTRYFIDGHIVSPYGDQAYEEYKAWLHAQGDFYTKVCSVRDGVKANWTTAIVGRID
ncbi:MAG TPA: hypothetical protein VEG38_05790 [Acidimicrobiia bacterium]|nr:hypothetical protein [Acidimicrobiia bacterium]